MRLTYRSRLKAKDIFGPVIGILSIAYFGFHITHGERGLLTYWLLVDLIAETEPVLKELQLQRQMLDNRVRLLQSTNLDPDMLEERARVMLNFGYSNDIIVLTDEGVK